MRGISELRQKQRREAAARLTSPAHILQNRFEEHQSIEGYFEDRTVPDFLGCDRLWKWDTLYGTVQMGYDPKRGQSFLFANIKTSIFDTAASQEQRKMNDRQRMSQLKTGNQNRAFSARRRGMFRESRRNRQIKIKTRLTQYKGANRVTANRK